MRYVQFLFPVVAAKFNMRTSIRDFATDKTQSFGPFFNMQVNVILVYQGVYHCTKSLLPQGITYCKGRETTLKLKMQ